jgi:hypothetical protein
MNRKNWPKLRMNNKNSKVWSEVLLQASSDGDPEPVLI